MRVYWCGVDDVEDGLAEECTSAYIPTSKLGADIMLISKGHILLCRSYLSEDSTLQTIRLGVKLKETAY